MNVRLAAYLNLVKPRIVVLVMTMTALGFFIGARSFHPLHTLLLTLFGTALTCGGGAALNNYLERDSDCMMARTRLRPIPTGLIAPNEALAFGILLVLFGTALLAWSVNLLTGFLALLTAFLYVLVYTPLKKVTWLNTCVGAIPGAIPPLGGWAAATGGLDVGAWILFLILFLWQHPHFFAIAWMYREDYRRGGFKMLPVIDDEYGTRTFRQILLYLAVLVPVTLLPTVLGMSGYVYGVGALVLGVGFGAAGILLARNRTVDYARLMVKTSVIYLPLLFVLISLDLGH